MHCWSSRQSELDHSTAMMSAVFTLFILTLAELQHISAESTPPPMRPPPYPHRPPTFTFLLTVFREMVLLYKVQCDAVGSDRHISIMSKPFLDKKATDQLNLSVLRRVDPDTEQVIAHCCGCCGRYVGRRSLYVIAGSSDCWPCSFVCF